MSTRREHELICRIVDREDDPRDWAELRELAGGASAVWSRLADGLEDDMLVRTSVRERIGSGRAPARSAWPRRPARATGGVFAALGWLAAIAVLGMWLGGVGVDAERARPSSGIGPAPTPRIVAELAPVLVRTETSGDQTDLVYLRRILERVRVDDVRAVHHDESGRSWSTPVQPASLTVPQSF